MRDALSSAKAGKGGGEAGLNNFECWILDWERYFSRPAFAGRSFERKGRKGVGKAGLNDFEYLILDWETDFFGKRPVTLNLRLGVLGA